MQMTQGNEYFETMQEYNQGMAHGIVGYLQAGRAILRFKQNKLWRMEGGHVKSFGTFVKHVLHISTAQAHRMSQVYLEFGSQLIKPEFQADISKVTLLLPFAHGATDEAKESLLKMAKDLTVEDLRNNLLEMQGKGDLATDVCSHLETVPACRCKKCNKWFLSGGAV
jgi:hypothetical protein